MKIIDYYSNDIMSRYKPKTGLEHRENIVLKIIQEMPLDDGASILDIGCGNGFFLGHLEDSISKKFNLYGVDYSSDQINVAKNKYPYFFSTCNLEEGIPFKDKTFDLVYAGEVIEHLFNPDLFIAEASRVLKENGCFLLSTPNLNSWINRILFLFGYQPLHVESSTKSSLYGYGFMKKFKKQDWPVGHVRIFNKRSLTDVLADNGFQVLACKGSVFEFMPAPLKIVDRFFAIMPGLSSDLVVFAKKGPSQSHLSC